MGGRRDRFAPVGVDPRSHAALASLDECVIDDPDRFDTARTVEATLDRFPREQAHRFAVGEHAPQHHIQRDVARRSRLRPHDRFRQSHVASSPPPDNVNVVFGGGRRIDDGQCGR